MAENKKGGFGEWYNKPSTKRLVGAIYSVGASVVIIGALFKILHWPFASYILSTGMITEAILFAIGAFEKPFKEYEWDKLFDFSSDTKLGVGASSSTVATKAPALDEQEIARLNEGIQNLSNTARKLGAITESIDSSEELAKNIDAASKATGKYVALQETLSNSTEKLTLAYDSIGGEVENITKNTKLHSEKVDEVNKKLSSINTVYEIQLKNIQAQSESLNSQTDRIRVVTEELDAIVVDMQNSKAATEVIAKETAKYKDSATLLSKQIADLNQVYGNMLNALSL